MNSLLYIRALNSILKFEQIYMLRTTICLLIFSLFDNKSKNVPTKRKVPNHEEGVIYFEN